MPATTVHTDCSPWQCGTYKLEPMMKSQYRRWGTCILEKGHVEVVRRGCQSRVADSKVYRDVRPAQPAAWKLESHEKKSHKHGAWDVPWPKSPDRPQTRADSTNMSSPMTQFRPGSRTRCTSRRWGFHHIDRSPQQQVFGSSTASKPSSGWDGLRIVRQRQSLPVQWP